LEVCKGNHKSTGKQCGGGGGEDNL
jgi:hypothetical protein